MAHDELLVQPFTRKYSQFYRGRYRILERGGGIRVTVKY